MRAEEFMFKILVADDDANTRLLFETVLKRAGYSVILARDGVEALEAMDKEHIDLAVVDIMMPRMDGYELTRELREFNPSLPILMVSAKQLPEDKHRGFLAGTDEYITKPID